MAGIYPVRGGIFYVLDQTRTARPKFIRSDECLQCHAANNTRHVPGFVVRSVYPDYRGYPDLLTLFTRHHPHQPALRTVGWRVRDRGPRRHYAAR
ncbi:MAG: hypothetical protein ACK562_16940, partial [Acidobacteriota bacterium]